MKDPAPRWIKQGNCIVRTQSIEWKRDELSLAAASYLEQLLISENPHIQSLRLNNGMGLLCNNLLHCAHSI
ncbi:MAG: hypothetical protein R8K20_03445 [Gallionellaceae bacterium]